MPMTVPMGSSSAANAQPIAHAVHSVPFVRHHAHAYTQAQAQRKPKRKTERVRGSADPTPVATERRAALGRGRTCEDSDRDPRLHACLLVPRLAACLPLVCPGRGKVCGAPAAAPAERYQHALVADWLAARRLGVSGSFFRHVSCEAAGVRSAGGRGAGRERAQSRRPRCGRVVAAGKRANAAGKGSGERGKCTRGAPDKSSPRHSEPRYLFTVSFDFGHRKERGEDLFLGDCVCRSGST